MAATPRQALVWVSTAFHNFSVRAAESYHTFAENIRQRIQNCFHPPPPVFDDEEIKEFMALTYLSKEEILRAYKSFVDAQPQFFDGEKNPYLPRNKVMTLAEFKVNPFRERMMHAVAEYEDFLRFEDYLELKSVLSQHAPLELKAEYLFRMYDFDVDDVISLPDLVNAIKLLIDEPMEVKDMRNAAIQVLMDGDLDGDGILAFVEFVHVLKRLEDFKSSFTVRP